MLRTLFFLLPLLGSLILSATVSANTFRKQQIAADLTVGYATTLVDINRDGHPELIVVPLMGRRSTKPHWDETGV
ncbi:MAG: hypothetical protein O3A37_10305 [Planctomycetota bacterium]|jgi:hypothetical protein|nr:hypothetical protein [Planctomycetota bacterium]